ncbi:MAG: nitroreductase/quinone reductase family protein [Thermoleophilaceae bacterium]
MVARLLMRLLFGPMLWTYRAFGQRVRVQGRPLLLLNTVGARSGRPRRALLGWFPDERPGSYLVAAAAAGSRSHPAWYLNLARHPDRASIEIGGRVLPVRAESLSDAEREVAWRHIVELAPRYASHAAATDRTIPVVRLTATG